MDPASVSALTFHVFGTVVDWRSSIIREGEAFGRSPHLSVDWKFADAWRGLNRAWRPLEHGPGRPAAPPLAQPFDVVAGDFLELAEKLGC
jgi:hypothetical protein